MWACTQAHCPYFDGSQVFVPCFVFSAGTGRSSDGSIARSSSDFAIMRDHGSSSDAVVATKRPRLSLPPPRQVRADVEPRQAWADVEPRQARADVVESRQAQAVVESGPMWNKL